MHPTYLRFQETVTLCQGMHDLEPVHVVTLASHEHRSRNIYPEYTLKHASEPKDVFSA